MIVALVFAHVWGVIQMIALGSFARTVRVRTVLMALAVGLYVCAPLAVVLQMGWIRPATWLTGVSLWAMKDTASYTANPFIEEILKVLPVATLLLFPALRRQWSLTDCVLTGAAAGSGFGLSESLFRYGAAAHKANVTDQGWVLTSNISFPVVPGIWNTINSWLPAAGAPWDQISVAGRFPPDPHLVWSALGGLAAGLIMLRRGWRWRTLGAVLLLYVALDHTAWNAAIKSQHFVGRATIEQLRTLWLTPILALALAWWLDRQRQRDGKGDEVSLAAEQSASPRLIGTVRAAVSRLPWSLPEVYGFVRMRRARNSERTSPWAHEAGDLSAALVQLRDRIDGQLGHGRSSSWLPGWSRALGATIRRPSVIVWLLLMVPSVMWFVIGGLPQTAALQETMTKPLAWKVVVALSVVAQAWLAWRVAQELRASPSMLRLPSADDAALFALRAACGVGAIGLGGYALMRGLGGFSPNSSLLDFSNQTDAYASGSPATGLQLANGAAAAVPPHNSATAAEEARHAREEKDAKETQEARAEQEKLIAGGPPHLLKSALDYLSEHKAVEGIAEVVGVSTHHAAGVGMAAGFSLGFESDNPGAVPKENVVYLPETTVEGIPDAPASAEPVRGAPVNGPFWDDPDSPRGNEWRPRKP